ncbi:chalcone isomerase-like protein 1 [Humulus lupulus]|uniref:chalcone isomerase-like protein 1 n=1 Tax=Humulus lupulus TaxID=3486 RepID=UPI002B4019B0|nr:chalcone isomerase-like protein 1 [Humulus lupulus]
MATFQSGSSNAAAKEVAVHIESKTGIAFPVKLNDGKSLNCVGLNKKSILGLNIKVYGFALYADNEKLKSLLKLKIGKSPAKPTEEMYQLAIDGDFGMTIKIVTVFSGLKVSMVKKNFSEAVVESIMKLTGGQKNEDLANKILGSASDKIKLATGSELEISKLQGYVLETKVNGELVSRVESELLCRAYFRMYLGEDTMECDKESREMFGQSMLSLF